MTGRAMAGGPDGGDGQRVAVDVAVIGKHVDEDRIALARRHAVIDCNRRIVDRRDGDGDGCRSRRRAPVAGGEAERAVPLKLAVGVKL